MFFDPRYMIYVLLPTLVLAGLAQWWVKNAFQKASQIQNMQGLTGAQAARRVLDSAGLSYIPIEPTQAGNYALSSGSTPQLNDHYDPAAKVLRLSPQVYGTASVAAMAVAAHEAGHAIQDAQGFALMRARSALVPAANIGSQFGWFMIFIGLFMNFMGLFWLGVVAFSLSTLFALITLPVELDASARAMRILTTTGMVATTERAQARSVLTAAAFTYVAGLLASILNLVYIIGLGGRRR